MDSYDEASSQRALEQLNVLDTLPDERVDRVTRLAQELFQVPMVSVTLLDKDRQWRMSEIGLGGREAGREHAFCDVTVRQPNTLIVEDASQDEHFHDNPFVTGDPHLRFYAGHPLRAPGGEPIGTLCIMDSATRSLDTRQQALLQDLAQWVQTEIARRAELDDLELIQRAQCPRKLPRIPGYTVASGAKPARAISGDFHDLQLTADGLRMTVADVMGKGLGPGIVAAGLRSTLRALGQRPPVEAMTEADRLLAEDLGDIDIFVTAFHGDLNTSTGTLRFVDAGHNLGVLFRASGNQHRARTSGLPLGMGLASEHEEAVVHMEPGDTFVCSSDGLLDLLDLDDPTGDVERIFRDVEPADAVETVLDLARAAKDADDVTVVIIRRDA
ncbi:PP2C family protein-serine/threonine phosphatase [Nesterenkonia sp. NBAIMH1]|uniref:PP2C family protein-serine/threonine phosphatase n=1 Tax=Nesterenkonia sp. NBAIMH1 TaxID=2600320 RepID=UPI0011B3B355|nr:GAF domain-containing SpoIIE family protein phosphatase [Nesterenkonia sp. NBAIMH1]